jgi:hypothetical protein
MSFPVITPFNDTIKSKIENTDKITFSGSKPFIKLSNFIDGKDKEKSIFYGSYTEFNLSQAQNYKERFPPIITGLSVGTSGNLGTIRKATINVKFASMAQLTEYRNFLKIGRVQLVTWGWLNNNAILSDTPGATAKEIVMNIVGWQNAVKKTNYNQDFLAGILKNFNIKLNSDATVDVEIDLGSPSDIPAYLSYNSKQKGSSITDTKDNGLVDICKALNLDGSKKGLTTNEIEFNSINYNVTWYTSETPGSTSETYIKLGFVCNVITRYNTPSDTNNKKNNLEFGIDLSQSVAMCHQSMISCNENVIFPNATTLGWKESTTAEGDRLIKADPDQQIMVGPINKYRDGVGDYFPANSDITIQIPVNGKNESITFPFNNSFNSPICYGMIENIYVRANFLVECAQGSNNVADFMQKIIDELNNAGAGLFSLILKTFNNSEGKETFSIVDLNLQTPDTTKIPTLELFNENSRIVDLSLNTNLPKEIVGQIVMGNGNGADNHDDSTGLRFFSAPINADEILKVETIKRKTDDGGISWEAVLAPFGALAAAYKLAIAAKTAYNSVLNLLGVAGPDRIKMQNSTGGAGTWLGETGPLFVIYKDVSALKTIYFGKETNFIRKDALVPTTISMTVLGIAGITIGTSIKFNPNPAPWLEGGIWQVTNVEHKVENDKWETIIEFKFRINNTIK